MKAVILFIGMVVAGLLVYLSLGNREEIAPITLTVDQRELNRPNQDVIEPVEQPIAPSISAGTVPAIGDEESDSTGGGLAEPESQKNEHPDLFYVTQQDFIRVHMHWLKQHDRYGSAWRSRLESELSRDDSALNSGDLEQAAVYAVIRDPMWAYDPPLSVSDLKPSCQNYVCKVEIPASVRVTKDQMAVRVLPGSILNTSASVQFSHGFGYHYVRRNFLANTATHYYLANGFELSELD
ncbi:MAG: hypothetical protein WBN07_07290 [Woeseiaceae bacterium]